MAMLVQCPNPACRASCSVAEANSGGPVRCPKCDKPFVVKPTVDAQKGDTKRHPPASNPDPFPALPAEFGRYRILKLLGRGGMGAVYLAQDSHLGRQVALKVPFFEASESPQRAERFVREARSAAVLQHPNICAVFDAGQIDGRPFITMAYIAGTPLEDEIDPEATMPQARAAEIVRKIALALDHAHRKGIVHRDLKPANVMMEAGGEPVVMDFGLAKRVADVDPKEAKLTHEGGLLGTPSYMAPEQCKGDVSAIGPATDVYALGVMLFEMLTGRTPYTGGLSVVIGRILTAPVPPVREFRPEVHSRLDAVCRQAMAKAPADRFASMAEFADALGKYLKAPTASPPPLPTPPVAALVQAPLPVVGRSPFDNLEDAAPAKPALEKPKKGQDLTARLPRRKWPIIAGAAVCLLLAGVVILWAAGAFRLKTRDGTIVLENLPTDAEVFVDGAKVSLQLKGDDRPIEIQAAPGKRKLEIRAGGFKMETQEVTLASGERKPIGIRLEPVKEVVQAAPAADPADALQRADIPEAVLASLGGGDPKRAPPELVAVLGDGRFRITDISMLPAYSPDGALLAVPSGTEAFLFDAHSGQLLRRFRGRAGRLASVAFSPNGKMLATGDEETVRLWDPRTGVLLQELSCHDHRMIWRLAITPDNQTVLSYSADRIILVWDIATGRQTRTLSCKAGVWSFAVAPKGRQVFAGSMDGHIYGWSLDTGEEQLVVDHADPADLFVCVSADGRWLASGTQNQLKVWKVADLATKDPSPFFEKQTPANLLQFDKASNQLWTAGRTVSTTDNRLDCWDPASGQLISSVNLRSTLSPYREYAVSPDGQTLAALGIDCDRVVQLYDTRTGKPRFPEPGHASGVHTVAFSPDGRWLASGSEDRTVRLWDLATGSQSHEMKGQSAEVGSVAFSPDGKLLASGSLDGTIVLWDSATGARVRTLTGYSGASLRFSPDGKVVAAGTGEGGVRMWSVRNGEEARMLPGLHQGLVRCLAFSADGRRLATGGVDGKLLIIDLAGGKILQAFQHKTSAVSTVEFGPDGETAAAGHAQPEPVTQLWNLKDNDFVSLSDHTDQVNSVSFRPDGRLAVTASTDGSVRLWEIGGNLPRKMVLGLGAGGERLWTGALSPDGRYVATGNSNGTIYLFRLPGPGENVGEWLAARTSPPPGLAEEAWLERVKGLYFGNVPDAVSDRLRELNPGFSGPVTPVIEGGVVKEVYFPCANVKDVSPLRALEGLRLLKVDNGPLADLSPLKNMKLETLVIYNVPVSDLSPLKDMPLSVFACGATPVSDLSALKGMKLTYLHCPYTPVSDLTPLKGMPLDRLVCSHTRVSDLSPLTGMPLTYLDCCGTGVSELAPVKDMKLTSLNCAESQVSDAGLAVLDQMSSLRELWIGGSKLTDAGLEHLKGLTDLEVLGLAPGKLTGPGLVHLKGMARLHALDLNGTEVTDEGLTYLKDLPALSELKLQQTRVTDAGLGRLAGLKNLVHLELAGTAVTETGVAKLKAALPHCNISR